ncbi:MAG: orotate phosphoribosyltransferase [Pyrinomonadaceae bacterium]|nr:orotate phosphoribosyltransferase [Pyrinomonadaceae bacterium]
MTKDEILQHFKQTNALLDGHFILSSGLHSPNYLQCALALQKPSDAEKFGRAIAEQFNANDFDCVVSPAIGGLIIGYETARALDLPFIWTERQQGEMTLRRGFNVSENNRFLVVEDVITTGGSTKECIAVIEKLGGKIVSAASIIDRSGGNADVGVPRIALATLEVFSYVPNSCPNCAIGEIAIKPGSRFEVKSE